jgi:hypothetical protein
VTRLQIPNFFIIFSKPHDLLVFALGILRQASKRFQLRPLVLRVGNALVRGVRGSFNALHHVLNLGRSQKKLVLVLGLAADEVLTVLLI